MGRQCGTINLPSDLRQLFNFDNALSSDCAISAVNIFKKRLKTVLFAAAFGA